MLRGSSTEGIPGSGASLADVAAALTAGAALAVAPAGADGLEQLASAVIDTASVHNPAVAALRPNIEDMKEDDCTPL
jgi:hypothetical protein